MIHDVITTANPFQYTSKFMFVGVRKNKNRQISCHIYIYVCVCVCVCVCVLGEINFLAKALKLSILLISLDIFDIRQHYIPFGIPRVIRAIESLGCNWWSNMHQIDA